ncbi:DNA breaking-rejoining protein [Pantoea osteomyelitidis]|uniref:DNA breaking-rejoining protein n=1 Tax=Pantoea osteomyelitidis TaxID=3230026 RepID=A0ABW7PVJ5_9GAMM
MKVYDFKIRPLNKSLASFNCNNKVSGVIHLEKDGVTTVVIDGQYNLGVYDCPYCAIEAITDLTFLIEAAEAKLRATRAGQEPVVFSVEIH